MTRALNQEFIQAAIAEDGNPISAGGPPLRTLDPGDNATEENGKFRAAAELEAGQPVTAGGPSATQ